MISTPVYWVTCDCCTKEIEVEGYYNVDEVVNIATDLGWGIDIGMGDSKDYCPGCFEFRKLEGPY